MSAVHGGRLFEIARMRGWDWRDMLDFSASINPLGPSAAAIEAVCASVGEIAHYPESHPSELSEALAREWNVESDQILLGNGATDLIHFLGGVFRDHALTLCAPVFAEFHRAFPRAKLAATKPTSGVTVISRPMNPTGELIAYEDWLAKTTHPVIADESFIEFSEVDSLAMMIATRPNLVVLRSLTKFYGIPGLRVGALIASRDVVAEWKTVRDPWSVNVLAIRAALASIADKAHSRRTLEVIRTERAWLTQRLNELPDVVVRPSSANFLFVRVAYPVAPIAKFLEDRKLLIRDCTGWPGIGEGNAVRVAVRTRSDNERLIAGWREFTCVS